MPSGLGKGIFCLLEASVTSLNYQPQRCFTSAPLQILEGSSIRGVKQKPTEMAEVMKFKVRQVLDTQTTNRAF